MNYFFGGQHNLIRSKLQIPLFQNRNIDNNLIKLFQLEIKNNLWTIEKLSPNIINSDFYEIDDIDNQKIFFLSDDKDIKNFNSQELINIGNFTKTFPEFRANLNMYLINGGFSSYQSEYPFNMVGKKGTILTPISTLLNKGADKNILIFRNIFFKPFKKKFVANFVDIKQKKIIKEISFFTNTTNFFEIDDKYLNPNVYLSTQEFIGVPIYLSIKNKHLSLEHTHPPHEYFFGKNKFKNVKMLKDRINEIFNK
jgi:hypothetical protein